MRLAEVTPVNTVEACVGFVVADFTPGKPPMVGRFAVAASHQGKGYGRYAVDEVVREAQRRGADRLLTIYGEGETVAVLPLNPGGGE